MDLKAKKANVERMLAKVSTVGIVTLKSDILDEPDRTARVHVRIINRKAEPEQPAKCEAVMTTTAFPIDGGELLLKGVIYDIIAVEQKGVGDEHIVQKVILHER